MKLLFWNLNKKDNADLALAYIERMRSALLPSLSILELNSQISS